MPSIVSAQENGDDLDSIMSNTPWYDANAAVCGTSSGGDNGTTTVDASGNNVKVAYEFFVANGFTPTQSAGIVGNLMEESTDQLIPTIANSIGAYGIAQWLGSRLTAMRAWVTAKGGDSASLGGQTGQPVGQLDYIIEELNTDFSQVRTTVQGDSTLSSVVDEWNVNYEKSGAPDGPRLTNAQAVFNEYGGGGAGATSSSDIGDAGQDCAADVAVGPSGCANPFRDVKNLRPERIDQGVDYAGTGPVYAICSGKITNISGEGGWDYGGGDSFITVQITSGAYAGKTSYMAEGCPPTVSIGQQVTTSTQICTLICNTGDINTCTGIETGWAPTPLDGTKPLAQDYGGNGCCSTTAGVSYNRLLTSVGTPSGILTNNPPIGTPLPNGYP